MIEIKKTLDVSYEGETIICGSLPTLQAVMGASSVTGNLNYYGVKKDGVKYLVPKKVVKARIDVLEKRVREILGKLEIMRQVVK